MAGPRHLLAAAALVALLSGAAGADADWAAREQTVKTALKSKDAAERARAFDPLKQSDDARAVDLVLWGVEQVVQEQAKIRKEQATAEKAYEDALTEQEKNTASFEASSHSSKDLDRYNQAERRISKARDAALLKLKDLENDFTRTRSQVDNAVHALASVLVNLPSEALMPALAKIEASWLRSKRPEDAVLWLDAVGGLDRPTVDTKIREVVRDGTVPMAVRVPALETLHARRDPVVLEVSLSMLPLGEDQFPLVRTAIGVLRRLHDRAAIEPLIEFLARPEIKGLREDAREALVSLTGQTHGPYADPWKAWWKDAKGTFVMPDRPVDPKKAAADQGGVTFYGIHTFSDRILFVLDVSGSMDQASRPGPDGKGGEPRIAIARKELSGAVHNLNDGDRFNVILFNHQVMTWQAGKMIESSETTRRQAVRWSEDLPPTGGTNIHDALETAFSMATRSTGRPEVDTILFMTDGRPTAGKIQKPEQILEQVRAWNRTAKLKIHCVGVGEHDEAFLATLAEIGGGEYVKR